MTSKKSILDLCLSSDESQFVQLPSLSQKQRVVEVPDEKEIGEEDSQRRVFNEENELTILKVIREFM
jgi:hypothetical protein